MKGIKLAIASLIAGATLITLPVTAAEKPVDLNALLSQVKASSLSESQLNKERKPVSGRQERARGPAGQSQGRARRRNRQGRAAQSHLRCQ